MEKAHEEHAKAQAAIREGLGEFGQWRVKADIMIESVAHLKPDFEASLKEQTSDIMREFRDLKTNLDRVVKKQTFWDNFIIIVRWAAIIAASFIAGLWAFGTFIWDHLPGHK